MCGILGILGNVKDRESIVQEMSELLKHRGPDDSGFYNDENVSLGHRRLSIIDLKTGRQPMYNEDNSIVVIFNGEIYNYQELRKDLVKKGHEFCTNSDTEVLVHLYEEYGIDLVKKLNGMFAFALWDKNKRTLYLVRDSIGIKPLYYSKVGDNLYFASEIKAIVQSGVIEPKLNEESLKKFFFYRYIPDKETMFEGIFKLLPGGILTANQEEIKIHNFKPKFNEEVVDYSEEECMNKLNEELRSSVKYRLIADVPIGTFLSGGIDSSSVTAIAELNTKKRVETFSVEFDTNDFSIKSEIKYAKALSNHFKINNNLLVVKEKEVIKKLPLITWHYDEPMGDAAVIPTFFISELAKKKVKVVLVGEGGDEQFAGYTKYENMLKIMDEDKFSPEGLSRKYMSEISVFMPEQMEKLFIYFDKNSFENEVIKFLKGQFENLSKENRLNKMLDFDQRTMLCENYLMKADKMSMAYGLEERVPLLDKNLLNFSSKLKQNLKIKDGNEKYILKKALKELLPEIIVKRKKQGYGTPTKDWFRGDIGKLFGKRIEKSAAFKKYFDIKYIQELYKNHQSGKENNNTKLWNLLVFDLWYEIYILRKDKKPLESYNEYLDVN